MIKHSLVNVILYLVCSAWMQESSKNGWFFVFCVAVIAGPQAGWVQGGSLKPPFLPLHTQPSYTISICKWPTSLTSIENHCCPKQVCLLRTSGCVQNAQLSSSCRCDEKTHVKKLLFQMLESSPFVLLVRHHQQWRYNWTTWSHAIFLKTHGNVQYKPDAHYSLYNIFTICRPTYSSANPSTFSCRNLMSAGLDKNSMQYTMSHAAVMALVLPQIVSEAISEHLISKNFPGEHFLRPLLLIMFIHSPILQSLQHSWLRPGIGQNAPCNVGDFTHSIYFLWGEIYLDDCLWHVCQATM